jgi:hypothetical protein
MALRPLRNQSRPAAKPRFGEQDRPGGACVTSAVNGGRIAFVIKLCPMMRAELAQSGSVRGSVRMGQFRTEGGRLSA